MDPSRSTDQTTTDQTTDFVTGKQKISLEGLTAAQWATIIRSAVSELPTKYLRRFGKKLVDEIPFDGNPMYGVERRVPSFGMSVFEEYDRSVCMLCFEKADFPTWEGAPRKLDSEDQTDLQVMSDYVLLSRKGQFTWIRATWQPRERWDSNSMSSHPAEFWYQLVALVPRNNISVSVLIDGLVAIGEEEEKNEFYIPPPARLLMQLSRIMSSTTADIAGQYRRAIKQQAAINGYLERLDLLAFD